MEKLYHISEVAALLGVKRGTIIKYISEGKLKGFYIKGEDNHYREYVTETDLDNFIMGRVNHPGILLKKLVDAERKERLAQLERLEYEAYCDACFYAKCRENLEKYGD